MRSAGQPSRARLLLPAYVLLFAAGALALAFLVGPYCRGGGGGSDLFRADLARFAPDDPVYVSDERLYVVRQGDGSVLALSTFEARGEDDRNGCLIRYRETLMAAGQTGLFRSDCTGTLYDRAGLPVSGPAPPMKRHPVTVEDGRVSVQTRVCRDADSGAEVACRPR